MAFRTGLEEKPWWASALVGLILAVTVYLLANHMLLKPRKENLEGLEAQLFGLQERIQEGRAAKAELPRFREEVRKLELELDRLLRVLPARRNTPALLRRIRSLTEEGDFNLKRFTPGGFIDRDFYSEWPIAISLEGSYHNLAQFFDRVGKFSRIINIEGLKVAALGRGNPLHTLSATFSAKTFVFKETEGGEAAE
ncbi:MAG: type 4a pilus biogenesis protein PilO [Thermoanaerobaculia bacterium]